MAKVYPSTKNFSYFNNRLQKLHLLQQNCNKKHNNYGIWQGRVLVLKNN